MTPCGMPSPPSSAWDRRVQIYKSVPAARASVAYSCPVSTNRRDFLRLSTAGAALFAARVLPAQPRTMPARPIPTTGERLPLVGLGSTRPVTAIAEHGPEPVAAVMCVMKQRKGDGVLLVFDLGGGTLDIALAESISGRVSLLAHGGVAMSGATDFDRSILDNIVKPWLHAK